MITLGCVIGLLLVIGISYAYWSLTLTQTENNVVMSDCFEIEFIEGNAINLSKAYPVSDEEGLQNVPYTFTIKNVCDGRATYQINLETLILSGKKLPDQYLKVNLMERNESKIISKLESNIETEPTIEGALSAYQLLVGELEPKEEKEFSLRIWMHSDVTAMDKDSMNAEYHGKISVITSYKELLTVIDMIKNIPIVTSGVGVYEVSHEDAIITYTTNETDIQNLKQTEYRFAGLNPNNYVMFNGELWRMIGLVNTPEGLRMKLIRNESIGEYSWDSSSSNVNNGYGVNEWSTSKMVDLLNNGAYYNRESGTCYNGYRNTVISCDFSSTGLTSEAKEMIDTITWNIGSNHVTNEMYDRINIKDFYNLERSNQTGKKCNEGLYCNDTVLRTTTWVGKVGLMYPSDYGYATSGGVTTDRDTCIHTVLYSWSENEVSDCRNNDWLYKDQMYQWAITPNANVNFANNLFNVYVYGDVFSKGAAETLPVIYLKTDVKIERGKGTFDLPYQLTI